MDILKYRHTRVLLPLLMASGLAAACSVEKPTAVAPLTTPTQMATQAAIFGPEAPKSEVIPGNTLSSLIPQDIMKQFDLGDLTTKEGKVIKLDTLDRKPTYIHILDPQVQVDEAAMLGLYNFLLSDTGLFSTLKSDRTTDVDIFKAGPGQRDLLFKYGTDGVEQNLGFAVIGNPFSQQRHFVIADTVPAWAANASGITRHRGPDGNQAQVAVSLINSGRLRKMYPPTMLREALSRAIGIELCQANVFVQVMGPDGNVLAPSDSVRDMVQEGLCNAVGHVLYGRVGGMDFASATDDFFSTPLPLEQAAHLGIEIKPFRITQDEYNLFPSTPFVTTAGQ